MTKVKKLIAIGAAVLMVGATGVGALAASVYKTPAEAAAGITGKTADQVAELRQAGKTYGEIAKDAGKLEEFKKENIQIKKDILEKRVADGTLTREKADEIIKALETNAANCDGTGSAKIGQKYGAKFGNGGSGAQNGQGRGSRAGRGLGTCTAQ